jgi:hypothetical protein
VLNEKKPNKTKSNKKNKLYQHNKEKDIREKPRFVIDEKIINVRLLCEL